MAQVLPCSRFSIYARTDRRYLSDQSRATRKAGTFFSSCHCATSTAQSEEIGAYLVFGVFNGASLASMIRTAKQNSLHDMRFLGFDAFEGLPAGAEKEDDGVRQQGFYACTFEDMQRCLTQQGIDPTSIEWISGWYDHTLTKTTAHQLALGDIGIIFIDCDTYSSSKTVLDWIGPQLISPAIICLDDWKLFDLDIKGMGEYQSFNEFLENNSHIRARSIRSYNRKSRSFLLLPA